MPNETEAFICNRAGMYAIYVLLLLTVTYLLNQLDRYALAVCTQPMAQEIGYGDFGCLLRKNVSDSESSHNKCPPKLNETACDSYLGPNGTEICYYGRTGGGFEYQILAGPIFIVIYTFAGIGLGYLADVTNRKLLLAFCLFFWSLMTMITGFATEYWQLVVLRFGLGFGEAGCTPFATSLIADYFIPSVRGVALGVYNIGIYAGYSMSYAFGDFITKANINGQGWRWVFWIAAIPGYLVAALLAFTVSEPERNRTPDQRKDQYEGVTGFQKLLMVVKCFSSPSLLLICLAGSIRNGAGYVWAYNTQPYFNNYYPNISTGQWLSWIPLVSGSIAVIFGGFISDRVVSRSGTYARIWVLIASLVLAAPFAAATLLLAPPWAFVMQIPTYIFGEMWVSVTLAVVLEVVPPSIKTTAVAYYFFIISNIGGNMPLLVPPIEKATNLRTALYILYPGCYVLAAIIFAVTMLVIKRDIRNRESEDLTSINPLLAEDVANGAEKDK